MVNESDYTGRGGLVAGFRSGSAVFLLSMLSLVVNGENGGCCSANWQSEPGGKLEEE